MENYYMEQFIPEDEDWQKSDYTALIGFDSLTSDIRGGINYGIDTCWYNPAGKPAPSDMNITCVATDFAEVAQFITGEKYEHEL